MNWLKNNLYKLLLLYGTALMVGYLIVRIQLINLAPTLAIFAIILFIAELHTVFHFLGMIYSLWPRDYVRYPKINRKKDYVINIFICVCGEPAEIVRETIKAAKETAAYYMKHAKATVAPRIYVLNDGRAANKDNWKEIDALAKEQGIFAVTRKIPGGFKAGNINNAMAQTPSPDEFNTIDIILDSDFATKPHFLVEIMKPFVDKAVDFVQTPQRYKNEKTWVAKAAAAHQIFFFEWICDAKAYDNALFLCGTNFAIRRQALTDVGGMDTKFITEDYATSLNLHMAGKKGVFIPEALALGVAPSTLKAYFSQQQRWSKGTFDTTQAYLKRIVFGPLTVRQKFHYLLSATYYFIGVRDMILMMAPLPYLFFGVSLIRANTLQFLLFVYGPLFVYNFILYLFLFREPLRSLVLDLISFPVFVAAFLSSALQKDLAFIVTIKKYEKESIWAVYKVQLLVLGALAIGIAASLKFGIIGNPMAAYINYFWASFDVFFLSLGLVLITHENYGKANENDELEYSKLNTGIKSRMGFINRLKFPVRYAVAPLVGVALLFAFTKTPMFISLMKSNNVHRVISTALGNEIKQELLVPNSGIYYGYYLPELNNHPKNAQVTIIPGEKPSLTMFYQDWAKQPAFDTAFMEQVANKNVVPVITWEPWNAEKAATGAVNQPEYSPKDIASGKYDKFIHAWAKAAADYNKPFFLRFAHEMNGNWYPWSNTNGNTPAEYVAMWKHVHSIFVQESATNVIWVWSPNSTDASGNSESITAYYPGDKYVDWVAFSGFNWGKTNLDTKWQDFTEIAAAPYQALTQFNKPIMVAETSSSSFGGDKDAWFVKTLTKDLPSYHNIKAVVFFHDDSRGADFSLLKGMHTYDILEQDIVKNSYFLKSPIIVDRY